MPSSTSNSSQALTAPAGNWGRAWLLALLLTAGTLVGWEGLLRHLGHKPSVSDNKDLWSLCRDRVYADKTMVLLGSSRMQLDVPPSRLQGYFPGYTVRQLAINGCHPFATLEALVKDKRFKGIVICEAQEDALRADAWGQQSRWLKHYRKVWSIDRKLNRVAANYRESGMVSANPNVSSVKVLESILAEGRLPKPSWLITSEDRYRAASCEKLDLAQMRAFKLNQIREEYDQRPVPANSDFLGVVAKLRELSHQLEGRGGKLVFVRMPTTEGVLELDDARYPRKDWWEPFAREVGAPAIHFRDVPKMANLECYDYQHLDKDNARIFTEALARELVRLGVVDDRPTVATDRP